MSPNEKLFKKDYAPQLLRIAESDLVTAHALARSAGIRPENILFHVEQGIEKAIKAVLCHKGKPVPFSHDILAALKGFPEGELPPGGFALHDLTPFATIRRYVEGMDIITPEEIQEALVIAEKVVGWAKAQLRSGKST